MSLLLSPCEPWGKRLISLAFVSLIVAANIWLVYLITPEYTPMWLVNWVQISVLVLALGGVLYVLGRVYTWLAKDFEEGD